MAISYQEAGVNIDAGNEVVDSIKTKVEQTFSQQVIGGLGGFGALYDLKEVCAQYKQPVLVQSIDGVGTKAIVARKANDYRNIGADLLSACSNDILALGAKPLTLMDYIANDRLDPKVVTAIVTSLCQACKQHEVSLVGGETAEMPDTYHPGEHDIVGAITGVVERNRIVDGKSIAEGDVVLGLSSSGLHTNGYSLARRCLLEQMGLSLDYCLPGNDQTLAQALLAPHINYQQPILAAIDQQLPLHGMAHITGGGLQGNINRIMPQGLQLDLDALSWPRPAIFKLLLNEGDIGEQECFRAFNMGIGFALVVPATAVDAWLDFMSDQPGFPCYQIGEVASPDISRRCID